MPELSKTKAHASAKHLQIDKANSSIVAVTAVAAFVVVFAIFASKALISQMNFQGRVIDGKETAVKQLKTDIDSTNKLASAYKAFTSTPQNIIGGNPQGSGAEDGDNAKIVLDALPAKYDFPALASSLEHILSSKNLKIQSISGEDDQLDQTDQSSAQPQPVPMPFSISVQGSYGAIKQMMQEFHHSVRPFQVQSLQFSGSQDNMTLTMTAQTFYQPKTEFNVTTKEVQ
jgi:Tfp pilus assembly protein PilO